MMKTDSTNNKVVIIVPTFNEAAVIERTIYQLFQALKKIKRYDISVVIFDSQSTDDTVKIVRNLSEKYKKLHLLTESRKTGLGSAYIQAMKIVIDDYNADIVFQYDGDGSHQPRFIINMLNAIEKGADIAVGSRYVHGGRFATDYSLIRKFISRYGNMIAQLMLAPKYKDWTSGLRAMKTTFLRQVLEKPFLSTQFAFMIELSWRFYQLDAKIVEVPITFIERHAGASKFSSYNLFDSLKVVITLRLKKLATYVRMCCTGLLGYITQFIAFNVLRLIFPPVLSNTISIELAIVTNFILHNVFTFRAQRFSFREFRSTIKKFFHFNCLSLGSLVSQIILTVSLMPYVSGASLLENAIVLGGIIFGSLINYYCYTRFIWLKT